MKCDVCGSDNLEGAAYCEDCGAKVVVAAAVSAGGGGEAHAAPAAPPPAPSPVAPAAPAGGNLHCPSCGAENPDTEMYCVDCGASLGTAPASAVDSAPPVSQPVVAAPAVARLVMPSSSKEYRLDRELTTMGRRSPADQPIEDRAVRTPREPRDGPVRDHQIGGARPAGALDGGITQ